MNLDGAKFKDHIVRNSELRQRDISRKEKGTEAMQCPKCDADISDSYQDAEPDVGIMSSGYYCEACDLPVDGDYEPMEGDVPIMTAKEARGDKPLGTPLSELSTRPGEPGYAEFKRIAKSYGYD